MKTAKQIVHRLLEGVDDPDAIIGALPSWNDVQRRSILCGGAKSKVDAVHVVLSTLEDILPELKNKLKPADSWLLDAVDLARDYVQSPTSDNEALAFDLCGIMATVEFAFYDRHDNEEWARAAFACLFYALYCIADTADAFRSYAKDSLRNADTLAREL